MSFLIAKPQRSRRAKWRRLLGKLLPPSGAYRPERYYMRGPGPKYRERHAGSLATHRGE
jgi:hypothetical protein